MAGDGSLSPSAFIPFCEFGADKAVVGERVAEIDVHVCNIFQEVTMAGQICYEVDVNEFKDSVNNTKRALETGRPHLLDGLQPGEAGHERGHRAEYNEHGQLRRQIFGKGKRKQRSDLHWNTRWPLHLLELFVINFLPAPLMLYGENQFAFSSVKSIRVRDLLDKLKVWPRLVLIKISETSF